MRYLLAGLVLACSSVISQIVFAAEPGVACVLDPKSVVSRSAAGIDQLSNVGEIQVRCSVPTRPVTLKPGEGLSALSAKSAKASLLLAGGGKREVPAEVNGTGGGERSGRAYVDFYLHLPLDASQREAEARRALARLDGELAKDKSRPQQKATDEEMQRGAAKFAELVSQHRVGRFHVECNLAQGDRAVGTGALDFDVLYKGRFSDLFPFSDTAK